MHNHPKDAAIAGPVRLIEIKHSMLFDLRVSGGYRFRILKTLIGEYESFDELFARRHIFTYRDLEIRQRLKAMNRELVDDPKTPGLMLLDRYGDIVPVPLIIGLLEHRRGLERARRVPYERGDGPVPRTGKCGGSYRWHRRPQTQPERRASQELWVDGHFLPVRARRQNIPNAWDDIVRFDKRNRNWKRYRKTRWKPGKE
jgi:hypothetical protein